MNTGQVFHPKLWDKLRGVQAKAWPDYCRIGVFSETTDAIGNVAENYVYGDEIQCRFNVDISMARSGYEVLGQSEVARNDTFLVLPINAVNRAITKDERIRITRRQGETIYPNQDFEVASPINLGTATVFFRLRPVDDYRDPSL